jgi:hypothetical protein
MKKIDERELRLRFPKGSKSFFDANAGDFIPINEHKAIEKELKKIRTQKEPNKTEREFSFILEAQKRKGEILRYEYQGITLRWFDMKYTPDWFVLGNPIVTFDPESQKDIQRFPFRLIEVKGPHIWDRDIVRFKGARAYWPEFQFEMHQKKQGQWNRIF